MPPALKDFVSQMHILFPHRYYMVSNYLLTIVTTLFTLHIYMLHYLHNVAFCPLCNVLIVSIKNYSEKKSQEEFRFNQEHLEELNGHNDTI